MTVIATIEMSAVPDVHSFHQFKNTVEVRKELAVKKLNKFFNADELYDFFLSIYASYNDF